MGCTVVNKKKRIIIRNLKKIYDFEFLSQQQARIGIYFFDDQTSSPSHEKPSKRYTPLDPQLKSSHSTSKLKKILAKNRPEYSNWELWVSYYDISPLENYPDLPVIKNKSEDIIIKDINRTFPNHPFFSQDLFGYYGQYALYRVLCKFSAMYPKVGYCQGMNYIVGFLLMISGSKESEVFSFLVRLCEEFSLFETFSEDMKGIHMNMWVFNKLFDKFFPDLSEHFLEQEITNDMWIFKWFLSLYTTTVNLHTVAQIWGYLLTRGPIGQFELALGLLGILKTDLMSCDLSEILAKFEDLPLEAIPWKKIISSCKKHKIKTSKIEKLKKQYQSLSNRNEVSLQTSDYLHNALLEECKIRSNNIVVQEITETLEELPPFIKNKSGFSTPNRGGNAGQSIRPFDFYKMGRVSFVEERTLGDEESTISKQVLEELINEKVSGDSFIIQVCNKNSRE